MIRKHNLVGQRFGKLTVLEYIPGKVNTPNKWLCKCDCGNITTVRTYHLINNTTKSCGCLKYKNTKPYYKKLVDAKTDLTGMKFEKLTVIKNTGKSSGNNGTLWLCKCDCGTIKEIPDIRLRFNQVKSCGCIGHRIGKDLTGKTFGYLKVLEKTDKRYYGYIVWKCQCKCGNIVEVPMHNLSYNRGTVSCGCKQHV